MKNVAEMSWSHHVPSPRWGAGTSAPQLGDERCILQRKGVTGLCSRPPRPSQSQKTCNREWKKMSWTLLPCIHWDSGYGKLVCGSDLLFSGSYTKVGKSLYWAWNWKNWVKKGKVSWPLAMAADAERAATAANILKIKSNIAIAFHPPAGAGTGAAAATAGAFPLEEVDRPAASGTSMVVESPFFIFRWQDTKS